MKTTCSLLFLITYVSLNSFAADDLISLNKPAVALSGTQSRLGSLTDGLTPASPGWVPGDFYATNHWFAAPRDVAFQVDLLDQFNLSSVRIWGNNSFSEYFTIGTFSLDLSSDGVLYQRVIDHNADYWMGAQDFAHNPPQFLPLTGSARYLRFTVHSNEVDDNPPPPPIVIPEAVKGSAIAEFEVYGTVIPEPSAAVLMSIGLMVTTARFLRRR